MRMGLGAARPYLAYFSESLLDKPFFCDAGIMCARTKKSVTDFAFGLAPDYAFHLKRGAMSATYYFLFQWAQENGLERVDLLRSRAHVFDGVYEHKRRWGAGAYDDGWPQTSLWAYPSADTQLILRKLLVKEGSRFVAFGELLKAAGSDEAPDVEEVSDQGEPIQETEDDSRSHEPQNRDKLVGAKDEEYQPQ
jgi:hypothetical protein